MTAAVPATGLTKTYGVPVAVDAMDMVVHTGEVCGFCAGRRGTFLSWVCPCAGARARWLGRSPVGCCGCRGTGCPGRNGP